jgi:hypothetical protein
MCSQIRTLSTHSAIYYYVPPCMPVLPCTLQGPPYSPLTPLLRHGDTCICGMLAGGTPYDVYLIDEAQLLYKVSCCWWWQASAGATPQTDSMRRLK